MILTIFITLLFLSLALIFYGWYSKTDLPRLIGFLFIFFLGMILEPAIIGSVDYKSGSVINETYVYGDNLTGHHQAYDSNITNSTTTYLFHKNIVEDYTYTSVTDHSFAFFLMVLGALGFILVMVERRNRAG